MTTALMIAALFQAAAPLPPSAGMPPTHPVDPAQVRRFERCASLAQSDAEKAVVEANSWRISGGGGAAARQCLGLAYAALNRFEDAAFAFAQAAETATGDRPDLVAPLWAQAGNALLLAGKPQEARGALDKALSLGIPNALMRGEAYLDRGRAAIDAEDLPAARRDLNEAVKLVATDPMGWLLSAALARRMNDPARAESDIAEALKLDPKAPEILAEAGNIAITRGDLATARARWSAAVAASPESPAGKAAGQALVDNPAPANGK